MGTKLIRSSVGLLLLVAALAACGDDAEETITGGEALGGGGSFDCMPYDEAVLAAQEMAFDGTLTAGSADGTEVTFDVHSWFRGGGGETITLQSGGLLDPDAQALIGTALEVGERYLISASGGVVSACGYSYTYDTALAADWAVLFGA